jgi:hypothetical protein
LEWTGLDTVLSDKFSPPTVREINNHTNSALLNLTATAEQAEKRKREVQAEALLKIITHLKN